MTPAEVLARHTKASEWPDCEWCYSTWPCDTVDQAHQLQEAQERVAALEDGTGMALDALGGMWSWSEANGYFLGGSGWVLAAGQLLRALVGRPAAPPTGDIYQTALKDARALLEGAAAEPPMEQQR